MFHLSVSTDEYKHGFNLVQIGQRLGLNTENWPI